MQVINQTRNFNLAEQIEECRTFWRRLVGGSGRVSPPAGHGWYIAPCRAVHTLGMRVAIDAVYLSAQGRVLRIVRLEPWRLGPWVREARGVLELPADSCTPQTCQVGDCLQTNSGKGW
ncbi:MAG: DUF192 domain-containing protein [candidate division FCPU426 bacterium]